MRVIQCLRLSPKAGMFGVEIEVEGAGLDIPENKFWRQEADGSLRSKPECCEYVFKNLSAMKTASLLLAGSMHSTRRMAQFLTGLSVVPLMCT